MKKIVAALLLVVVSMLFAGCSLHEFKAGDPLLALEQSKETSKAACYEWQALNAPDYSKLDDMAVVVIEQQKAMVQMFGAVTGKNMDPCSGGTNLNDVLIADSTNRNNTARAIAGTVGSVATTGIIAAGVVAGVESIGENSGIRTYGDSSPATKTTTKSETHSTATNAGDGAATANPGFSSDPLMTDPLAIDPVATDPVVVTPE